jgi:putative methyltransferase (TIGR04325 family)
MDVKSLVRRISPPILLDAARALREAAAGREWEYVPEGWRGSAPEAKGWLDESILETQRARWPGFLAAARGRGPLALSPEASDPGREDIARHNTLMVFGYVLARAAHGLDRLSLLDWGGGLGHYYVIGRALLPDVTLDYHCRDTALLTSHGRTLFPEAHFYDDDATCFARTYDLVLASSSLQYSEDWPATLARLAGAARRTLLVTRLPVVEGSRSFVVRQRAHRHGYRTEYLGWVIDRGELLERAAALGLTLEREFLIESLRRIHRAPQPCASRGFLFASRQEEGRA